MDEGVKRLVRRAVEATSAEEAKQFASAAMDCAYAIKCSNGRSGEEPSPDVRESCSVPVVVDTDAELSPVIGAMLLSRKDVNYLAGLVVDGNQIGVKCRIASTPTGLELLQISFVGLPATPKA